jgi:cytochrome c biogenesis protein CcmG, thiol:disulfide interchange protein DsbE
MQCLRSSILIASLALGTTAAISESAKPRLIDQHAPDFSRLSIDHQKVALRAYRGKVVLLSFWATWCKPCLSEMPAFSQWQDKYDRKNFQVIGVSMDDMEAPVTAMRAKLKLDYPVVMGDEYLGNAYGGVLGLPVTFLIDREGRIQAKYEGAANLPHLQSQIENLLNAH